MGRFHWHGHAGGNRQGSFSVRKDSGPMGITVGTIQNCLIQLLPSITKLINAVILLGYVPNAWRKSYIVPIPKKRNIKEVSNYRGIAIQSAIPKILNKVVTNMMQKQLASLIPRTQHGFMKKRSTISNLMELTEYIDASFTGQKHTDVTISHRILAAKLAKTSMPFILYRTIMSFVTNRSYQLKINGTPLEQVFQTTTGVPQVSHCDPFLFILYTRDIIECISAQRTRILSYADDTEVYVNVNSEEERHALQQTLNNIEQ